ncbi:MAG TPA: hypothetical protein VK769_07500 [Verrucomicrobiae bacterium]|nr:hypothetical protein [Verrucomicrobiae bacterium]
MPPFGKGRKSQTVGREISGKLIYHANHSPALDFIFRHIGRSGLDFIGVPSIKPDWLRDGLCARGNHNRFLVSKKRMANADKFSSRPT